MEKDWKDYFRVCVVCIEIVLTILVLYICSDNDWSIFSKGLLLILSIVAGIKYTENKNKICEHCSKRIFYITMIMLSFYASFALVGNKLFLYPIGKSIGYRDVIKYMIGVLWSIPYIVYFLSIMIPKEQRESNKKQNRKSDRVKIAFFSILVPFLVCSLYSYAFNPAITSSDTQFQIWQAKGISPLANWQTPFHTLFIRFVLSIYDSVTLLVLVQSLIWGLIWCDFMFLLYQLGAKRKRIYLLTLLFFLFPTNALHLAIAWKDIPYAAMLLGISIQIAKYILLEKDSIKIDYYIKVYVILVCLCLLRQNGIVPYIMSGVALLILSKFEKKMLVSLGLTVLSIILFYGPVFTYYDIQPAPSEGKYYALAHDITGVLVTDESIERTDSQENIYNLLMRDNSYGFSPYTIGNPSTPDYEIEMYEFLKTYIQTFFQSPVRMIQSFLCRINVIYAVFPSVDEVITCVNPIVYMDGSFDWNEFYPQHKDNLMTEIISGWQNTSCRGLLSYLCWRVGLYTLLGISGCIGVIILKKKRYIPILIPCIGQVCSLILSTGWPDYRYYWPIMIMVVAFYVIYFSSENHRMDEKL